MSLRGKKAQEAHPSRNQRKGRAGLSHENRGSPPERELIAYARTFPSVPDTVVSPVALSPAATRVVLKYSERITLSSTSGITATHSLSGNSLHDPNATGVGGQPLGYDQWSTLYSRYRVLASTCQVQFIYPGTTNGNTLWRTNVIPSNGLTAPSDMDVAADMPYSRVQLVNAVGGGLMFKPLIQSMETDVIMGVNKQAVLADDQLSASTSSSPSNQWYWHIQGQPVDQSTTASLYAFVVVYYLCDFFERWTPGASARLADIEEEARKSLTPHGSKSVRSAYGDESRRSTVEDLPEPPTDGREEDPEVLRIARLLALARKQGRAKDA